MPVSFADGPFHRLDAEGQMDPAPLTLDASAVGDGVQRVSWSYGMSAGNAVLFSATGGCWMLVEDPEPPMT